MKSISKFKSKINKTKEKRQPLESKRSRISRTARHLSSEMDIKEHGKIKEILKESRELYRFLFNNSNDALFVSLIDYILNFDKVVSKGSSPSVLKPKHNHPRAAYITYTGISFAKGCRQQENSESQCRHGYLASPVRMRELRG